MIFFHFNIYHVTFCGVKVFFTFFGPWFTFAPHYVAYQTKALWKRNPTMVISERFVICRGRKKWFKIWSLGVYGKLRKKWGQCSWNFTFLSITARDIWVASLCTKSENFKLFSSWIIFIWSKHHFNQIWSKSYHVEHTSSRLITEVKQHWAELVLGWVTAWEYSVQ